MKKWLVISLLAFTLTPAFAADETYTLKPDRNLAAVLGDLSGRTVTLHLRGGKDLTGKLSVVGTKTVQLSELQGKEFYDAVVAVDAVEAIEVRVRSR